MIPSAGDFADFGVGGEKRLVACPVPNVHPTFPDVLEADSAGALVIEVLNELD